MISSIPEFLVDMLEEKYGKEISKKIGQGYLAKRNTTFRINTLKTTKEEILSVLEEHKITYQTVKWSKEAILLENASKKEIEDLEIYQSGKIYLQSLSSMLPPIILDPQEKEDILDMAAAPGGKTTQIASITNNLANITACEKNKIRVKRLAYNLEKQGAKAYIITQDATKIDNFFSFDRILLDAPCSGSGTIELQNSKIEKVFTKELIQNCIKTQELLLKKAICLLKPGKEMVYSTCSILANENEKIIEKVLKEKVGAIQPISLNGMEELPLLPTKIPGTLCVAPTQLYEGFFIAKIKKIG